jgi:hypothetical protein
MLVTRVRPRGIGLDMKPRGPKCARASAGAGLAVQVVAVPLLTLFSRCVSLKSRLSDVTCPVVPTR